MFELIEIIDQDELIEVANRTIDDLRERTIKTIEAAEDTDLEPLNESDIKAMILSHANRLIEVNITAPRSVDIDDLIIDNLLHR
mgnify:CR=1 FL=1